MRKRNYIFAVTALLVFSIVIAAACAPQQRPNNINPNQPPNQVAPTPPNNNTTMPTRSMAETLADEITNLDGVKSAYVLIIGRTAMIGVNLDKEKDDKMVEGLKDRITKLAEGKGNINEALISADPEIVEQIRDVFEGRSTPDSIGDIYTRLKPQS